MSTAAKSERLMKLLIMLLVQRHYVAKDKIRSILYPEASTDAFEKMFERDKEELRSLGVPIEVGNIDAYFDDEPGYRIRPDLFALPEIDLAPDEAAIVGLATRVWEHQRLARATTEAVRKLTAAGIDIDLSALDIAQPRLVADEPAFDVFLEALAERSAVEFDYWRSGTAAPARAPRRALGGHAVRRTLVRPRLRHRPRGRARLPALPCPGGGSAHGQAGRLRDPCGRSTSPPPPAASRRHPTTERAVVLVRAEAAAPLRRMADTVEPGVAGPDTLTSWDRLVLTRGNVGLEDEVLGYGASVYVEAPATLRGAVVSRLEQALARSSA